MTPGSKCLYSVKADLSSEQRGATTKKKLCKQQRTTIHSPIRRLFSRRFWQIFSQFSSSSLLQVVVISFACLRCPAHSLLVSRTAGYVSVTHSLHCSYEEQMRIGGMKADQWWGDKPWDGVKEGWRGGGSVWWGQKRQKGRKDSRGTKQGAERGYEVTRPELG